MILCCGEALIDMIPSTTVDGDECFVPKAGGALFNTSIALSRLGTNVGLFTGISDDLFGELLQKELRASGVNTRYLSKSNAPSTLAFVEMNDGQADYTFYAQNTADTSLTVADIPKGLDDIDAMLFGGISLCTDPTATTLHSMMRGYSDSHVMMLDPNIRPSFIKDEDAYRRRLKQMVSLCDILKISDEDLNWMAPDQAAVAPQIDALIGKSPKLVFVTKGSDGAVVFRGTEQIAMVRADKVAVADTIGAGDTFNAGVLNSLANEGALTKAFLADPEPEVIHAALRHAVKVAAITVSRTGANPPWISEV